MLFRIGSLIVKGREGQLQHIDHPPQSWPRCHHRGSYFVHQYQFRYEWYIKTSCFSTMPIFEITGNAQSRFIQAAALLHLIDPVRGEPTAYSLDLDSDSVDSDRDRLLKRKLLDSFALICATKKDGDTVSAACLEDGFPEGTVVRVASNQRFAKTTLSELRQLVAILNGVAGHGEY